MATSYLTDHATAVAEADPDHGVPTGLDVWKRTIPTGRYEITDDAQAELVARTLGLYPVEGAFQQVRGTVRIADPIETSEVTVEIAAASIDTGVRLRDAHLRSARYLAADQHPTISFVSEHVQPLGNDTYAVHGQLTLRGVTEPAVMHVTLTDTFRDGDRTIIRAVATADIDRRAFAIPRHEALALWGALVDPEVRVRTEVVAGTVG